MIEYSSEQFEEIKEKFPNLYFEGGEKIKGELDFHVRYKDDGFNGLNRWVIEQCRPGEKDCITDVYSIEIDLSRQVGLGLLPAVTETDGRIQKLAKSLGATLNDMHLNKDGTCCLGIFDPSNQLSLYDFILERVYPYFVWQAYFNRYKKTPPCGEYPHNLATAIGMKIEDEKNNLEFLVHEIKGTPKGNNRNIPCPCGNNLKYKDCCFKSDGKTSLKIIEAKQDIRFFIKKKKNMSCGSSGELKEEKY